MPALKYDYSQNYEIEDQLANNPRLVPSPPLYNFDEQKTYSAIMGRLAEPLPDGQESPFSYQGPGSAHGHFTGVITHYFGLMAHELNLRLDKDWIDTFRMLGVELEPPEYPVIMLEFERAAENVDRQVDAVIPVATEINSRLSPNLTAITTRTLRISGSDRIGTVPARINRLGNLGQISPDEFNRLPPNLSGINRVLTGEVINEGRAQEGLVDAMLRAREGIRTGSLGQFSQDRFFDPEAETFLGRCVTNRDYLFYAMRLGASKANAISGIQFGAAGRFDDLSTLIVYPPEAVALVEEPIRKMATEDRRVDIRAAQIVPVSGKITVRVVESMTDSQARQLVAKAISPTYNANRPLIGDNAPTGLNPPAGLWGDQNFSGSLGTILENEDGIYAVPYIELYDERDKTPLTDLEIMPWHLFEIQQSIEITVTR